jgi:CheY-like chemotaxis protein
MIAAATQDHELPDIRILVVEDNFLAADSLVAELQRLGYLPVGPVASLAEALAMLDTEPIDGAILDINIIGGTSAPIAERLLKCGCPFFFITGYASPYMLPASLKHVKRLNKPLYDDALREAARLHFPGRS